MEGGEARGDQHEEPAESRDAGPDCCEANREQRDKCHHGEPCGSEIFGRAPFAEPIRDLGQTLVHCGDWVTNEHCGERNHAQRNQPRRSEDERGKAQEGRDPGDEAMKSSVDGRSG